LKVSTSDSGNLVQREEKRTGTGKPAFVPIHAQAVDTPIPNNRATSLIEIKRSCDSLFTINKYFLYEFETQKKTSRFIAMIFRLSTRIVTTEYLIYIKNSARTNYTQKSTHLQVFFAFFKI
jgi:hypothetical protein